MTQGWTDSNLGKDGLNELDRILKNLLGREGFNGRQSSDVGIDRVHNFWWKVTLGAILICFN